MAVCVLAAAWHPQAVRADGDPASDVLLYQPIYFPYQPAPAAVKRRLTGLVRSANSQGYQIRVAIVQSRRDLGSITQLFDKPPAVYAQYLSAELSGAWHYRVLVVFPNGYGLAEGGAHFVKVKGVLQIREDPVPAPDKAVIKSLRPPSGSSPTALIDAAGRALRALAARHDASLVAGFPARTPPPAAARTRPRRWRPRSQRRSASRRACLVPVAHPPGSLTMCPGARRTARPLS